MGRSVDYFFAPQSPWTYLGHERFVRLVREQGAQVRVRPVDLGRVFAVSGGLPLCSGQCSVRRTGWWSWRALPGI